jgi:hypothetical protein
MSVKVSDEGNISATNVSIKKATFAVGISVSLCAAAMLGRDPGRWFDTKEKGANFLYFDAVKVRSDNVAGTWR